jgi:hypothetical protein
MDKTFIKQMALAASLQTGAFLLNMPTVERRGQTAEHDRDAAKTLPGQTSIPNNGRPVGIGYSAKGRSQPGQDHREDE